jgi:integrase
MSSVKLSYQTLGALRTEKDREDFYDQDFPSLIVRVGRSGSKTFVLRYRSPDGTYRRVSLGKFPAMGLAEAREQARRVKLDLERGEEPAAEAAEERARLTVADLSAAYLERYAKRRKRSWAEDERILRREVLPVLGDRLADEVKKRDGLTLLEAIVERGSPVMANRVLAVARKMYNWAVEIDLLEHNPFVAVKRLGLEVSRTRVLALDEIRKLWQALDQELPTTAASFRLLLLLGQRSTETSQMTWADLEGDVWTIPPEVAKTKRPHLVPLSREAQREIARFRGQHVQWVLPSPRRDGPLSEKSLGHAARRLVTRLQMEPWTPHDLRRTVATRLGELGFEDSMIGRVLGHSQTSVEAIHNRYAYLKEKREALEKWERRLLEIVAALP